MKFIIVQYTMEGFLLFYLNIKGNIIKNVNSFKFHILPVLTKTKMFLIFHVNSDEDKVHTKIFYEDIYDLKYCI